MIVDFGEAEGAIGRLCVIVEVDDNNVAVAESPSSYSSSCSSNCLNLETSPISSANPKTKTPTTKRLYMSTSPVRTRSRWKRRRAWWCALLPGGGGGIGEGGTKKDAESGEDGKEGEEKVDVVGDHGSRGGAA